ncbi:MAG TPA: LPS assembly protein LptD [Steroidobacteraceae bacterium]|nr:LPS assembly protein LptD [Steroidobacteraceae bacterium]
MESLRRRASRAPLLALSLSIGAAAHADEQLCGPVAEPLPAPTPPSAEASEEVEISSDSAALGRNGDAELKGNVQVRQGDKRIGADDVSYDAETGSMRAEGSVSYEDPLIRVHGERGSFERAGGASLGGAEFELPSRPARGAAREIAITADGKVSLDKVEYTTCPVGNEDWILTARDIDLDIAERNGSGRNVRLDFKGIPILYTPWISFPLGAERKSGFLFPDFGVSDRSGIEFAAPYYFNLAPNYDLTLTPRVLSDRGFELDTEFRYLGEHLTGGVEAVYLPDDQLRNRDRSFVHWSHLGDFARRWRVYVDAANASDENYFEDFGQGSEGTSVIYVERDAELRYYGTHWDLLGQLQNHQIIDQGIAEDVRPYTRAPRLTASGRYDRSLFGLSYALDGEAVYFERDAGVTGGRVDVEPAISWPITGPGYYVVPRAAYRYTQYELGSVLPGSDESPSRSAPIGSLDAGMIFERPSGRREQRLLTFEPRVLYLYVPFRDQTDLPVFDTALPDLNLVQLFRRNRYVGADRLSDSNQLSAGATVRMIDVDSGRQYLSGTLGEAWYFEAPRVTLPNEPAVVREYSNLVGELDLTAYQNWNVSLGIEWDPDATQSEKGELSIQYRPASDRVANVGYRYRRSLIEQVDASVAWPVARRWHVYAGGVYSLREETLIEEFAGLEYGSCCWKLRAVYRQYVSSRTGERDSSIAVQLELSGLSNVGVPADAFLEGAIRGYSRPRLKP